MSDIRHRAGSTLLELVVALAVLGIALGVASVAFRHPAPDRRSVAQHEVARARQRALASRRPVSFLLRDGDTVAQGVAYPDGRVLVADTSLADPMTGRPDAR